MKFPFNTKKQDKQNSIIAISDEPKLSFTMTPQLEKDLLKARKSINKNKKETVVELKKMIQKYPHVTTFYNYLAIAYQQQGREKEEYELIQATIKKFPNYFFARINLLAHYIITENITELDKLLGDVNSIKDFAPEIDTFHISEIASFYSSFLDYLAYKNDAKKIKEIWSLLEKIAQKYEDLEDKLPTIKAKYTNIILKQTMSSLHERSTSMLNVIPINTSSVKENNKASKPVFNHKETEELYITDIDKLTKEKIDMFLSLPKKTFIEDLEMVLEDIQTRKEYFYKFSEINYSLPYYALTFLSVLEAKESVNKMLNIFRQDKLFIQSWFDFYFEPSYVALIFYKFYKDDFEGIFDFVKEENNEYTGRAGLISIPAQVAINELNRRKEVLDFYEKLADYFIENKDNKAIRDHNAVEYLTHGIKTMQGKELREKVVELNEAGLVNAFLDGIENILEEIDTPFYSSMQSRKIDIAMPIYEIFERLENNSEFFLPNTEEEKRKLKEHHENLMKDRFGDDEDLSEFKDMFSSLLQKNNSNIDEDFDEYDDEPTVSDFFSPRKATTYQRNDKVTVRYTNGKIIENTKYKKVEKDVKEGKCFIVD